MLVEQQDMIITQYQSGLPSTTIAEVHGLSKRTILRVLSQNNIPRRTLNTALRQHSLDESFFDCIDTEKKAYWLGFLLADGNIGINGRNGGGRTLRVALKVSDKGHLEKLKNDLSSSKPLKENERTKSIWLQVVSKLLCTTLENHGWYEFKGQGNLDILSIVPSHLIIHLLRGLLDGDGWICIDSKRNRIITGFCDMHRTVVQWYHDQLVTLGLSPVSVRQPRGKNEWVVDFRNHQVKSVLKILYQDSTVYLDRKHNLVQQLI